MLAKLKSSLREFYPYAKKRLGFDRPVRLFLRQDPHNAEQVYGKTAYYDPQEEKVVLYVTNRHPKDILRSFAHELVHHKQNCEGRLSGLTAGDGYAQTELGDKLETEAYVGSKLVRDYEDTRRKQMTTEELKQKVENIVKEYLDEKKGKGSPADNTKPADEENKADFLPKNVRDKINKEEGYKDPTPEDEKKEVDEAHCGKRDKDPEDKKEEVDEGSCGKRDREGDKKKKKTPAYTGSQDDEHAKAMEAGAKISGRMNESKTPQPKPEQSNEDWYWGSLYDKLKDKWTK